MGTVDVPVAVAAFLQVRIIRSAGSLFLSQVSYMVPLWSVVFGITLLGEDLPPQLFVALALIFAGIGFSQWSTMRRRQSVSRAGSGRGKGP